MDRNELVELVLARVVEKLAQRSACQEDCSACAAPAACGKPDNRPGLLVLTQEHGEECHSVLEDGNLQAQYRTECAMLRGYQVELDGFEAVVLYELTNEVLCKLANGICDTPYSKLALSALLSGKQVFAPAEQVEAMSAASAQLPAPYRAMLQEKLAMLAGCGLKICPREELVGAILNSEGCCAAQPAVPAAAVPAAPAASKELCLNKRVITERDVTAAVAEKVTCIHIGEKSILTALAAEYAKSKGIRLVRDA